MPFIKGDTVLPLQGTNSSANCENPDTGNKFSCTVSVLTGSVIIVFAGCLVAGNNCQYSSITDSQGDVYSKVIDYDSSCGTPSADCYEAAYTARASATGTDTLTFTANMAGYLGADVYAVNGYVSPPFVEAISASPSNGVPSVGNLAYIGHSFVVAGVIANSAQQFSGGRIDTFDLFTMIPGQPCFSCGEAGGWQASEYNQGTTEYPPLADINPAFGYPSTNGGWLMIAMEFQLVTAPQLLVSCSPSPAIVGSQTKCSVSVVASGNAEPTGNVSWSSGGQGTFSPALCTLSSKYHNCLVYYTPSSTQSPVTITAKYGGDLNDFQNSSSISLSVAKAASSTSVSCTPSPETVGGQTTCTATVTGFSPTGTINWASSGVANFSPANTCTLSAGSCAVNYVPSTPTTPVTITGSYVGDANNTASSSSFPLSVTQAQSGTSTTSTTTITNSTSSETTSSSSPTSTSSATSSSFTTTTTEVTSTPALSSSSSISTIATTTTTATVTVTSSAGSSSLGTSGTSTGTGPNTNSSSSGVNYVSLGATAAVAVVLLAVVAYVLIRVRGRSSPY